MLTQHSRYNWTFLLTVSSLLHCIPQTDRVSGLSPFAGECDVETMGNVTVGKYDFNDEAFDTVSADCMDFIAKLLKKNPKERLTAYDALKHRWVKKKPHYYPTSSKPAGSPLSFKAVYQVSFLLQIFLFTRSLCSSWSKESESKLRWWLCCGTGDFTTCHLALSSQRAQRSLKVREEHFVAKSSKLRLLLFLRITQSSAQPCWCLQVERKVV